MPFLFIAFIMIFNSAAHGVSCHRYFMEEIVEKRKTQEMLFKAIHKNDLLKINTILDPSNINAKNGDRKTAFILTIELDRPEIFERFLKEKELDINLQDRVERTPLFIAASKNDLDKVRKLLEANAKPNIPSMGGDSPLIKAIENNNPEMVKLLLDYNANPDQLARTGVTPLTLSIAENQTEITQLLLDANADVNKEGGVGHTPLVLAVKMNDIDTVKLLLDKGAKPFMQDYRGTTPLLQAFQDNRPEIAKLILKALGREVDDKAIEEAIQDAKNRSNIIYRVKALFGGA